MKKLALFFTAVFLIGTSVNAKTTNALEDNSSINNFNRGYGNSFIFTEGGIEFSVFPDGQFDFYVQDYGPDVNVSINTPNVSFSFNNGFDYNPYVQYDDFGAIIQIENTPIYYDFYGRVTQVGNVDINYNNYGRVARVGGLYVHYNSYRTFTHCTGFINVYNRIYIYRPWHVYYAIPAPSFCIVYSRPYRQYYTPVRHYYYRPYVNNHRQAVSYNNTRRANNNNSGRRGDVAIANTRISDRYRQEATPRRSEVNNTRNLSTSQANTITSQNTRLEQTTPRTNERVRSNNTSTSQSIESNGNNRTNEGTRTRSNERARSTSQTGETRSLNSNTRTSVNKNTSVRKPNNTNTRISNKGNNERSNNKVSRQTSSNNSKSRATTQQSSTSRSKRGN